MSGNGGRGCRTVGEAVALAKAIRTTAGLEFGGIQAYAGHIQHISEQEARRSAVAGGRRPGSISARRARTGATRAADRDGGPVPAPRSLMGPAVFTRNCRPGRTFSMDADYLTVDMSARRFSPALFVDTTVVGVQWDDHVTTDAGTKAFALKRASAHLCSGGAWVGLLLRR